MVYILYSLIMVSGRFLIYFSSNLCIPLLCFFLESKLYKNGTVIRSFLSKTKKEWVEEDSNLRSPKAPDLQSGAIDHSAIHPSDVG